MPFKSSNFDSEPFALFTTVVRPYLDMFHEYILPLKFSFLNRIIIGSLPIPAYSIRLIQENVPGIDILEYPSWKEYEKTISKDYDIVGISFYTPHVPKTLKMISIAREHGVKEIWGGNYGVMTPGMKDQFNRVFVGHGENSVSMALWNKPIEYLRHPIIIATARHAFFRMKVGYLVTTRGCNMSCEFCPTPPFSSGMLQTPLSEVERVLDEYQSRGVRLVGIMDENFFNDPKHAQEVIKLLSERDFLWECTVRADKLNGKVEKLRGQGLISVGLGIESFRDANLQSVKKKESADTIIEVLKELEDNGCFTVGTYILCFENDTLDTVREDIQKLAEYEVDALSPMILTPFPGSPLFEKVKSRIIDWNWEHYDGNHLVFKHPHITPEGAIELMNEAFKASSSLFKKLRSLCGAFVGKKPKSH